MGYTGEFECSTRPAPPVLIVGAGPTGLTLAYELLRRGVKPRLIEKTPHASHNTKALGVTARTLELLAPAGITHEMLAQGVKAPTFSIWSSGQQVVRFDFASGIDSPYPFILMIPQHTTEAILTEHILHLGGMIERGTELVSLAQRADGVEAVLRHADGTEEQIWSSFLVGCDGAHSTVRHLLGVPFVGTTIVQSFATGDVRMHWNIPHDQALAYLYRGRFIAYFPLPDGQHRILIAYPAGEAPPGAVTLEEVQQAIDVCGPAGARASDPGWLARYHVHQRKVDSYIHQRVLLAGDAAHIHSPLGAQGMNTGIQDAINLGWKLALVMQGSAPRRLLESYQIERARVSARLLQDDTLLTRQAFLRQPLLTATRDHAARHLMRHPQVQRYITRTASALRISYRHGPLISDYCGKHLKPAASTLHVGDRAPNGPIITPTSAIPRQLYDVLTGTGHALLLFLPQRDEGRRCEVQAVLADWQGLLDVYPIRRFDPANADEQTWYDPDGALARRYGIANEGLVLIRPDGYISFRCRPIAGDALQRYLRTHFTPKGDHLCTL